MNYRIMRKSTAKQGAATEHVGVYAKRKGRNEDVMSKEGQERQG